MSRKRRPAPKKPSRPPTKSKSGPPDQSGRVITQVLHEERRISGPLPTPDILLGYDDVLPGAAERIMRMAEKEQAMVERDRASAREVEGIAVQAATADNRRGQTFGFLVALAAFGTAGYLGYLGHGTAAAIVGGGTVVALVTVFVTGRRHQSP